MSMTYLTVREREVLSTREREVLMWAAEGKTASETANILKVSTSAVNLYASRAMSKLRAHTKTQAVAIALRNSLLPSAGAMSGAAA